MTFELSLARQLDLVFKALKEELTHLTSGTVFVQIRNNAVGKFGIRHFPLESKGAQIQKMDKGLTETEQHSFRQTALESLKMKRWTHGEIQFEFAMRQDKLCTSVTFESNYNMANLLSESTGRLRLD
ncbi:O-methyltransferase [Paenibacillus filicis]|uniref:O-methyltransferase n=1 Tax=Paenibacillus gyeongsangnamensis TaxID=3388067 RepID=A0ABT4QAE7_9BACL|nr:O-methyltransferase [Paenibacillus filicis]MCZ8513794.1 O-methyltransferase [Paenibacillus filicis]